MNKTQLENLIERMNTPPEPEATALNQRRIWINKQMKMARLCTKI